MEMITETERQQIATRLKELQANRSVLSQRIADARALGDLKENAEYHSAREQQGLEEAEIRRLEDRLAHASVVDESKAKALEVVFLGSLVRVKDVDSGDEEMLKLVGECSVDPPDDYDEVTVSSPMGEALLKARVGEVVRFNGPRRVMKFEIMELL